MGHKYDMGTCCSCGTKRIVTHKEWIRASRPRCYECGGPLEQSAQSYREHVTHKTLKSTMAEIRKEQPNN